MRWVQQVPLALRPFDNSSIGCADGGGATDALALPPVCFRATLRFKDRFLPCPTNTLVNTRQRRRFAQAALKLCGSLEQRRDLGNLPDFYTFECRACGVLHFEAAYIEAAYIEAA